MRLFLFNPENDIALASGLRHFTPPRQAQALHRAGAMLPFWLGEKNDYILVPSELLKQAQQWRDLLDSKAISGPIPVGSFDEIADRCAREITLSPWGWSLDTIEQFRRANVPNLLLNPFENKIEIYRRLSHRQNQLIILHTLRNLGISIDHPLPICGSTVEEVHRYVNTHKQVMIKSPWSSSGRGVFPVTADTLGASLQRIRGIIRHQGSVMVEPLLPKIFDFALLFNLSTEGISFKGVSVFQNSTSTNYTGNLVASQQELQELITRHFASLSVPQLIEATSQALSNLYGGIYEGPLGVDMLVYTDDNGTPNIAPCIEVNLRYTMGFVAHGLHAKSKHSGILTINSAPKFRITFFPRTLSQSNQPAPPTASPGTIHLSIN